MEKTQLLTYYRWKTRRSWRLDSLEKGDGNDDVLRYIFRDVGAWKKFAEKDTTLWVVGLSIEGHPTLEAVIKIEETYFREIDGEEYRGVVGQKPSSRFFGLNDAEKAMSQIAFHPASGKTWRLAPTQPENAWSSQHGRRLQNPMRIAQPGLRVGDDFISVGVDPLVELANSARKRSVFISYKYDDLDEQRAREFLDQLAVELTKKKITVWLDRVALVGTGGQKIKQESNTTLTGLLMQGLRQCPVVLGIWSRHYGTPSRIDGKNWTRTEWSGNRRPTRRIAMDSRPVYREKKGFKKPDARVRIPAKPGPGHANAVANRIERVCRPYFNH